MLWQKLMENTGDHRVLRYAFRMLDDDRGLTEKQYFALQEYVYDEQGAMRNATFLDYRIPTCYDLPMMDTIIVEVPDPQHPYGVRGVGEVPIVPPPAALVAAIYQAVGVRMRELPASPPRLLHQILQAEAVE